MFQARIRGKASAGVPLGTRALVAAATAAIVLGAVPGAAAQIPPRPLAPEMFQDSVFDPDSVINANCNPDGISTITYRLVDGVAGGNYPGTFDEHGTITIGPQTNTGSPSQFGSPTGTATVQATFTIDSPLGQVTGKKSTPEIFEGPLAETEGRGVCRDIPGIGLVPPGREFLVFSGLRYEAEITTSDGTYRDSGTSTIYLAKGENVGTPPNVFSTGLFIEHFLTSEGVVPANTPGKSTGGGQLPPANGASPVSFGFEAISDEQRDGSLRFQGRCAVEDRARNTSVRCLNVTSYTQVGNHATFRGEAEVNGQRTEYRIDVDDLGEPNQGRDTFKIVAGGYAAAGNVPSGDIQVFVPPGTPQG